MRLSRRALLHLSAGAVMLPTISRPAIAQTYPSQPVHWIVTAAAGGPSDTLARLLGAWLSKQMGQQFIVENRTGAGGNIGTEFVVRSPADGYTIHMTATSDAINATLYDKLNFNLTRDITPIACLMRGPFVMVVRSSFPARTVSEFIAYAKANPGKISFGSGGTGFAAHIAGEMLKMMTGIDIVHVPYRGQAPAMTDLLGGRVQVMFDPVVSSIGHIRNGELRALAVTTSTRSEALPDVPPLSDSVPGYEASIWFGVGAPRHTPSDIVDRLNREINAGLADPNLKKRLAEMGTVPSIMSPEEYGKFVAEEVEKWGKVVRAAHLKVG